jgi:hypothetical protein
MHWSDLPTRPSRRVLRQFAALWLLCFLALGTSQYFLKGRPSLGLSLAVAALVVGVPGLIWPSLLRWLFVAAMVVTFPLGWLISLFALAALHYLVITPVAVCFRLRGRDLLGRRPAPGQASFWEPKRTPLDLRSYFRQY